MRNAAPIGGGISFVGVIADADLCKGTPAPFLLITGVFKLLPSGWIEPFCPNSTAAPLQQQRSYRLLQFLPGMVY